MLKINGNPMTCPQCTSHKFEGKTAEGTTFYQCWNCMYSWTEIQSCHHCYDGAPYVEARAQKPGEVRVDCAHCNSSYWSK